MKKLFKDDLNRADVFRLLATSNWDHLSDDFNHLLNGVAVELSIRSFGMIVTMHYKDRDLYLCVPNVFKFIDFCSYLIDVTVAFAAGCGLDC